MKKINSKSVKITKDTSDILKQYHQDIRNIKPIPKKEELELFIKYKDYRCLQALSDFKQFFVYFFF